jgi:glycosyltransferase involved in cell wall biosynthesis
MNTQTTEPAYLYAPAAQVNEATSHYIETMARAMQRNGRQLIHVEKIASVPNHATTIVVECKSAIKLRLARPSARYWIWLQGIVPEEARLHMDSVLREQLWNAFERYSLFSAQGLVMVSEAMREHYLRKFPKLRTPIFVMPCVNASLDPRLIRATPDRYDHPSFVYAGSMHAWQGIDLTLASFARLQSELPLATLTILTKDRAAAQAAVNAAGLSGVTIDFVALEALQSELAKYKYGFVLRDNHIVNQVATPTKVSSYMAAGVIPIMTDAVKDYAQRLRDADPIVIARDHQPDAIADEILKLENQIITADQVIDSYGHLFSDYFDHDKYINRLSEFFARRPT